MMLTHSIKHISTTALCAMIIACNQTAVGAPKTDVVSTATAVEQTQAVQTIHLDVTEAGFEPAEVAVKAGTAVKLIVTRKVEKTCATDIVMAEMDIRKALPLNQPVEIEFVVPKSGSIRYACAMDMISGLIVVQ